MEDHEKEAIRRENPLEVYLPKRGVDLKRDGREWAGKCPFHKDNKPSLNVNLDSQLWICRAGCGGGDVFAFVQKLDGISFVQAAEKLAGRPLNGNGSTNGHHARPAPTAAARANPDRRIVATYSYTDAAGKELFQALRFEPKDFRQRRRGANNEWIWNLDGVDPTLYRMEEVKNAAVVWICEGEKDADTLASFGVTATCNPMGAGKWKDEYSKLLEGKEIILCGDNDEPGQKHMDAVEKSLANYAKHTKRIKPPDPYKDLSDFVNGASTPEAGMLILMELAAVAPELYRGIELPFQSMVEMERDYLMTVSREATASVDLSRWLPSLRGYVRPLVPGELVSILAPTGAGKTAILQNIAMAISPLPVLLFELELPGSLTFERFAAMATGKSGAAVYQAYQNKDETKRPNWRATNKANKVFTCSRSNLTVEKMTRFVNFAHLKLGERPAAVMVDYFGLVSASGGSRYERMSAVAEELKVMAKSANVVVIAAAQVDREATARENGGIFLSDAKDSGSIENSSGLVLGAWRDAGDESSQRMFVKVLKNTKGFPGRIIECRCDETLRINEISNQTPPK